MSRDASTSCERQIIVVTVGITREVEFDGAHGARPSGVGGVIILKYLDIGSELQRHVVVIWQWDASDNACRTHGGRDMVGPRELVETPDRLRNQVMNHQFWDPFERQTMDEGPEALLGGAHGAFNFADMTIGRNDVDGNRQESVVNTGKFIVSVNVTDLESAERGKVE